MNVLVFLVAGVAVGHALRGKRVNMGKAINLVLLAMIFLLGVKTGKVRINGVWLLEVSAVFATLTVAGSFLMVSLVRRWL